MIRTSCRIEYGPLYSVFLQLVYVWCWRVNVKLWVRAGDFLDFFASSYGLASPHPGNRLSKPDPEKRSFLLCTLERLQKLNSTQIPWIQLLPTAILHYIARGVDFLIRLIYESEIHIFVHGAYSHDEKSSRREFGNSWARYRPCIDKSLNKII